MIPVQDVVPSGRPPLATLALLALNILSFATNAGADVMPPALAALFGDVMPVNFVASLWFLWLFGDNVEARTGRLTLIVIYLAAGSTAMAVGSALGVPAQTAGLGITGSITGILGAYFLLLPRARVLMFVPAPPSLVEVPALFFLGCWWMLQLMRFVVAPSAARLQPEGGAAVWALGAAMLLGALVCLVTRRPVVWR